MDYVEAFTNLRTNNKYGRKSPHKAILMLTVIEMYEKNIITDNEIYYDDSLKSMFLKVWNKVLPNESRFHPEAYLPFWYLQNDSFWHIVPVRGKEDILSLMRDTNIKPSEAKLNDSVRYAELDDDLYFLMTIASGRSSLKRALLETYTNLPEEKVKWYSISLENTVDHSAYAMDEYEKILSSKNRNETVSVNEISTELEKQFKGLSDDLQIALSYEYFAFLKNHRNERDMLREICPNVFALYDCIIKHSVQKTDISPSFAFIYDNFLSDLKISLMSENGSMDVIDKIDDAIAILRGNDVADGTPEIEEMIEVTDEIEGKEVDPVENKENDDFNLEVEHVYLDSNYNVVKTQMSTSVDDSPKEEPVKESRKGRVWTLEEEELLTQYFQRGNDTATIAEIFGRTEVAIKTRLAKLGLIEYTYGQDETTEKTVYNKAENIDDFKIENSFARCYILNKDGERVYATDGKLKYLNRKMYRLNSKKECFTVKRMDYNGDVWIKGAKKIVAFPRSRLYEIIVNAINPCEIVQDIKDSAIFEECKLKVNGLWYNNKGELESDYSEIIDDPQDSPVSDSNEQRIVKHPLYNSRKQALIRALSYFRLPAKIKDIARTISRTAWGATIKEDDVEEIISTLNEVESVEDKYILRKR